MVLDNNSQMQGYEQNKEKDLSRAYEILRLLLALTLLLLADLNCSTFDFSFLQAKGFISLHFFDLLRPADEHGEIMVLLFQICFLRFQVLSTLR